MTLQFKRLLRPLPLIIVAVVAIGAWLYWHNSHTAQAPGATKSSQPTSGGRRNMPLPPVQVATANVQNIPRYLSGLGTVTAANTVTVRNRVDGQIMAIHFTEGQEVNAGDLLVEIDPRPYQVQLTQAEGQLLNMQATLSNAKRDLVRYQKLIKTNMVSQQQLDTQQALVKQSEGSLKAAQGAVDSANLQLTYSKVTAPISGRVGLKLVDVGNYVSSGDSTGLVVITQTHPIDVLFALPETDLNAILPAYNQGKSLSVEAWDRGNKQLITTGTLLSLDNQIDTATGTIKLKARFTNQDNQLFPNQFVNARIKVDTLDNAIVVPAAAIQTGNNENFVWVINDENKVSKQPVTVGLRTGETVVVSSGIKAEQRVVTDGVDRLKQDMQVEVVTPQSLSAPKTKTTGQPQDTK
ncbi:MdtA/MuxA family multidrug efflux RND transporter periplasmic adaptor subunit [Budviciaceae bacterium BWR-B9]|uniref:MdtA/MuxA family multidrug efflux RND transporter periplasmic adaptor subunit n=1 Tax=Limnobaculum allomyrinae TaxID=2791986 RepID=A0ABS1IL34_9GAMM|nr:MULTISPECIES: MdtA/MuxA family multidrug efflux RND transporter periplasmic adaptor subunit [Limnobaculum]MBK5142455.1 MdtA/MuxA family multidrug efflux RND transporter periplasmic adaptor subunit [Limnobaculum allomyrinae]MBV7690660.1 MdtA/MuxA family multidrug efflux RND transporter periplasmic adaptor subunit [Limnobaculum sp. M2-1]